jgi:hypothetical protein
LFALMAVGVWGLQVLAVWRRSPAAAALFAAAYVLPTSLFWLCLGTILLSGGGHDDGDGPTAEEEVTALIIGITISAAMYGVGLTMFWWARRLATWEDSPLPAPPAPAEDD